VGLQKGKGSASLPLDLRPASPFSSYFFSLLVEPPRFAALSIFSSPVSLSLPLLPPSRPVYIACVAHVSHGICYVVHGTPAAVAAAAATAAADRLIRGPTLPFSRPFFARFLGILICLPRFSRFPSCSCSPCLRAHRARKNRDPATGRPRACVTRVCGCKERVYHDALSLASTCARTCSVSRNSLYWTIGIINAT